MHGPRPSDPHPMAGFPQVCFIRNVVKNPHIVVGDYTYYDDPEDSENFERNVLYHYPFVGDKLVIGKFCALARGVKFIMNGANHKLTGFSTSPFGIFGQGWEAAVPAPGDLPRWTTPLEAGNRYVVEVAGSPRPVDEDVARDTCTIWFERISSGLDGIHITTDRAAPKGQVTETADLDGSFYITYTGGNRVGALFLMVAVDRPQPEGFGLALESTFVEISR